MFDPDAPTDYDLRAVDFVLAALTFPLLMFVLMFATSGMASMLEQPSARLKLGLGLVVVEIVAIALVVWLLVRP